MSSSGKDNIDTAAAVAAVIGLTPCQSRYSIRESTNMITRPPWCPSQAQPSSTCGYTNLPQISGFNPSASSLLPQPFSCHALLGLIPLNTLPSSLQPFHDESFEALSAIPRVQSIISLTLSLACFLSSCLSLKSGLLDRQLSAKRQICLCYSPACPITRCYTLISQRNPSTVFDQHG